MSEEVDEDDGAVRRRGPKTLRDVQKTQLDKLMANPDKPVPLPERPKDWKPKDAPDFVRFYMGSSAGAGSEVFHVYRHLRRRENIRQQWISETAERDDKDLDFQQKLVANVIEAEERTAKKRAKRLKRKQRKVAKKTSGLLFCAGAASGATAYELDPKSAQTYCEQLFANAQSHLPTTHSLKDSPKSSLKVTDPYVSITLDGTTELTDGTLLGLRDGEVLNPSVEINGTVVDASMTLSFNKLKGQWTGHADFGNVGARATVYTLGTCQLTYSIHGTTGSTAKATLSTTSFNTVESNTDQLSFEICSCCIDPDNLKMKVDDQLTQGMNSIFNLALGDSLGQQILPLLQSAFQSVVVPTTTTKSPVPPTTAPHCVLDRKSKRKPRKP